MDTLLASIAAELPDLPPALAESWLAPLGENWRDALAARRLEDWQALAWRQERITLEWEGLSQSARRTVHDLLSAHVHGEVGLSASADGKQRIGDALRHLVETGTLPGPLVLIDTGNGLDIVSGAHRLAALFTHRRFYAARAQYPVQTEGWAELADSFEVWVGQA